MQLRHHRLQKSSKVRIKALVATNTASHPGQQEKKKTPIVCLNRYHHTTLKTDIKQTKNGCFYSIHAVFFQGNSAWVQSHLGTEFLLATRPGYGIQLLMTLKHWPRQGAKKIQSPFARSSGSFETSKSNKVLYVRCLVSCSIPKSRLWNWSI